MIDVPSSLSPIQPEGAPEALAVGPFAVERTDPDGRFTEIGFLLTQADETSVTWTGPDHQHAVTPISLAATGDVISFQQDGTSYLIRPLEPGDGVLVGVPDDDFSPASATESQQSVTVLAELIWNKFVSDAPNSPMGEDNLYLTRNAEGEPLALVKMSSSHPTLVRQDKGWRTLADEDEDLLGASDIPVREAAVTAWDSGNIKKLETLLMDDRFSPIDILNTWVEVEDDTDRLERLLVERSRGRFYERTSSGTWAPAQPRDGAVTIDVVWSAINAWDDGELSRVGEVQPYDAEGDAA